MTSEPIALVVADLKAQRVRPALKDKDLVAGGLAMARLGQSKVVDATSIYKSLVAKDEPVYIYEDHPSIAPPFAGAHICYVNEHGNVIDMVMTAVDHRDGKDDGTLADTIGSLDSTRSISQPKGWETAEPVDWDRVRWTIDTLLWLGGRGSTGDPFPTTGPIHCWRFAVYDTGEPADLHWIQLVPEYPMERWDMAHLVLLGTLNFLNCRNVELAEPKRARPEARRLARTGVQVYELNVFPTGRTARSVASGSGLGVPLASVRGHFSHYGDCCPGAHEPRGLLFGALQGRFWIPQHARGTAELGEHETAYKVRADA